MTIYDWPNLPPLAASIVLLVLSRLIFTQTMRRLEQNAVSLYRVRFALIFVSLALGLFGLVWWTASTRVP